MNGQTNILLEVIKCGGSNITFEDNSKGQIVGKVKIIQKNIVINNALLVENMCYILISINQLFVNEYLVEF